MCYLLSWKKCLNSGATEQAFFHQFLHFFSLFSSQPSCNLVVCEWNHCFKRKDGGIGLLSEKSVTDSKVTLTNCISLSDRPCLFLQLHRRGIYLSCFPLGNWSCSKQECNEEKLLKKHLKNFLHSGIQLTTEGKRFPDFVLTGWKVMKNSRKNLSCIKSRWVMRIRK